MTDSNTIQHTALIRVVRNVVDGQEPIGDVFTKIEQLVGVVVKPVEDALATFVKQFASDFGSQALTLAAGAVGQIASGQNIKDVAATLLPQITAAAVTDAEKDGTVVLNALRVQLTAAATQVSA